MINLKKSDKGIYYIENVSYRDLMRITSNLRPICDECCSSLIGSEDIILVPLANEAYCTSCGRKILNRISLHMSDSIVQDRRVKYYMSVLRGFRV